MFLPTFILSPTYAGGCFAAAGIAIFPAQEKAVKIRGETLSAPCQMGERRFLLRR